MLLLYLMESRWCREELQTGRPQFARYEDKHCFITVICSQARATVSAREKIYAERLSRKVNGKVGVGWGGWDGVGRVQRLHMESWDGFHHGGCWQSRCQQL